MHMCIATEGISSLLSHLPLVPRIVYYVCFFFLGATLSDFFQCLVYRHANRIDLFIRRSFCDSCGTKLRWFHLVPVASYICLRGRCAFCDARIDPNYALSDLFGGVTVTALAFSGLTIPFLVFYSLLAVFILSCDFLSFRAPFVSFLFFFILNAVLRVSSEGIECGPVVVTTWAVASGSLALAVLLRSRLARAVSFACVSALALSPAGVLAELAIALCLACAYALGRLIRGRRLVRLREIPLVSFLAAGFAFCIAAMDVIRGIICPAIS
jgi:leader peptidase (prepilin peptidase)/N-methyltransferase